MRVGELERLVGREVLIEVSGCWVSCCGRGPERREGRQEFRGELSGVGEGTVRLVCWGLGSAMVVIAGAGEVLSVG